MSKQKTYTIALKATAQTDPIRTMASALMDVHRVMSMVNLPFRLYHEGLRVANVLQGQLATSAAAAGTAEGAESGLIGTQTTALDLLNSQLAEAVVLEAALAGAAGGLPGMAAGTTGGLAIVSAAMGAGAVASLDEGGTITESGIAKVTQGETFSGVGGGAGGGISITNHISVDPAGMDLTDFTNKMNQQLQSALRSYTRDIPS